MLTIKRITYESVEIDRKDLITVTEAAALLKMSLPGVVRAVERGVLTEIVDDEADPHKGRRLLIKAEVDNFAARRSKLNLPF